MEPHRVPG